MSRAMSGLLLLMPGILQVLPALGKRTAFINKEEKDYLGDYFAERFSAIANLVG